MRSFIGAALVLTIATSLFACVEPDTTDDMDPQDRPTPQTLGPRGSTGSNKQSNADFIPLQVTLAKAARESALVDPGTQNLTHYIQQKFLQTTAGRNVLSYAVACTVPDEKSVGADGVAFDGLGHLANGAAWLDGPLPHATINELMACMAAHVNAWNEKVPILLLGSDVQDDSKDHSDYSVSEALWKADVNGDDVPFYTVWPSKYVAQECFDVLSAFKDRVCGQYAADCNFTVGPPGVCFPSLHNPDGDYLCNGVPVIETRLIPEDMSKLYPNCRH